MDTTSSDSLSEANVEDASLGESDVCTSAPLLSPAEARNLAYVVSDRVARSGVRLMTETPEDVAELTELASNVADKLNELSLRLCSDEIRGRLGAAR